jgi:hypothetical protein
MHFHTALIVICISVWLTTSSEGSTTKVNRPFGTISNFISKIHFNLKSFVVVKQISFENLAKDNRATVAKEMELRQKLMAINMDNSYDYKDRRKTLLQDTRSNHLRYLTASGLTYEHSRNELELFNTQLRATSPLALPEPSQMAKTEETLGERFKRFVLAPIMATVMSVAKLVGPTVCAAVLNQASEAIGKRGISSAAERLVKRHGNYIQAPNYTQPSVTARQWSSLENHNYNVDFGSYYNIPHAAGDNLKMIEMFDDIQTEVSLLNTLRETMRMRNNEFMQSILTVKQGQIPVHFLPPKELQEVLRSVDSIVANGALPLQHITQSNNVFEMYQFLTPILIIDQYQILLIIILPMIPSGNSLDLYQLTTLPFLTQENVALEIKLDEPFYATDLTGSQNALLSRAEYDACTKHDSLVLCRTSRPLLTKRSDCYHALHFAGSANEEIFRACRFLKADGTKHKFVYISPNTFAYFLPAPSQMFLNCPANKTNEAINLPRAGIFSYPPRCSVNVNHNMFFDTSVEHVQQSYLPQADVISFLQVARGSWPTLYPQITKNGNLMHAATDSNFSEPLAALSTRAHMYAAMDDIRLLNEDKILSKKFFDEMWGYIATMAAFITTHALYLSWQCICKKQTQSRTFYRPKLAFRPRSTDEEKDAAIRLLADNPPLASSQGPTGLANATATPWGNDFSPENGRADTAQLSQAAQAAKALQQAAELERHAQELESFERRQQYYRTPL